MVVSPKLSVIIVSWNVNLLLQNALKSIYVSWGGANGIEVIVVDNASSDDSVSMVEEKYPQVHLIVNQMNLGYPAGCNQGLAAASVNIYWY